MTGCPSLVSGGTSTSVKRESVSRHWIDLPRYRDRLNSRLTFQKTLNRGGTCTGYKTNVFGFYLFVDTSRSILCDFYLT